MERKPSWLKVPYNREASLEVAELMKSLGLNTVCKEANCPNLGECYKKHTATFMILGSVCTRNCKYCNVTCGRPEAVDEKEPENIAEAVKKLNLRHVVITQVDRDDLKDGGAGHMARTIKTIKENCKGVTVEVLISDYKGNIDNLKTVLDANPDVLNHNIEMPKELYGEIKPQANYDNSIMILRESKRLMPDILTKTGFMLGLGETDEQIFALMDELRETNCDILTIGQYLQPSANHAKLYRYVTPEEFEKYKNIALEKGFKFVVSTPLVRSSYRAHEAMQEAKK